MFKDLADGIFSYGKAWRIIAENKLWYYVMMPGLISIILGGCIGYSAFLVHNDVSVYLTELYPVSWYGHGLVERFAHIMSWFALGVAGFLTYRNILMGLLAPFMSPLAARVQAIQTGQPVYDPPFLSWTNMRLILRGLFLSLRNLIKELWYTMWLFLLGFIPIIGLIAPFLIFFVQSFYAGFSNLDYTLEKYYNVKNSKSFAKRHQGLAIGNGMVFLLMLTVPILGLFFAPALSATAATLEAVKRIEEPLKNLNAAEDFI
jgi:CysZ protein